MEVKKTLKEKSFLTLIIFALIGMILINGCNLGSDNEIKTNSFFRKNDNSGSTSYNLNGNRQGIQIRFTDENPPKEVYKDQPFTFGFIIENYLESPVEDLTIKVSGFDKSFVKGLENLISEYKVKKLPKATKETGKTIYSGLIINDVKVSNFVNEYNFNPIFDYCYTARTKYFEQICIPSKKTNNCEIKYSNDKYINGPVQVKIKKIINLGEKIKIIMDITNAGNGKVVNECFKGESYSAKFKPEFKLGTKNGKCTTPNEDLILVNGKTSLICEFERTGSDDSYVTQISGILEYKYQQQIKKEIKVLSLE